MPPNPWKLLRTEELTTEQRRDLQKKLVQRKQNLAQAMKAVEQALQLLSRALDQDSQSRYSKKIVRKRKVKS
jgi:hypothetical protein